MSIYKVILSTHITYRLSRLIGGMDAVAFRTRMSQLVFVEDLTEGDTIAVVDVEIVRLSRLGCLWCGFRASGDIGIPLGLISGSNF